MTERADAAAKEAHRSFVAAVIVALAFGSACSESDGASFNAVRRRVVGDRVVWPVQRHPPAVLHVISGDSVSSAPLIQPSPTLVLGSGERGETDEFGLVSGVAVDNDGRVFVLDALGYRVRVYDRNGFFVRDIGRRGRGPGEFSRPHGDFGILATAGGLALSNDTLFVLDERVEDFDTSGVFIGNSPPETNLEGGASLTATEKGLILGRNPFEKTTLNQRTFGRYSGRGTLVGETFTIVERFTDYGINFYGPPVPLPPTPYAIGHDGHVYFAVGDTFHIDVFGIDGQLEKSYISNPARVPSSHSDVDDYINTSIRFAQDRLNGEEIKKAVARSMPKEVATVDHSRYREIISALIVSPSGTILIRRSDLTKRPYDRYGLNEKALWTMMDSAGHPLSTVSLPTSYAPKVFLGCSLYGVEEAEDGTQRVVRFDLATAANRKC